MPPDIPSELYSLFIDRIALEKDIRLRTNTLKACSLASRALSHQTRQYLFYRIKFPKTNATNGIQHFRRLLVDNPRGVFISYLRVLEIELKPYLCMTNATHGLPTLLNILCADERGPLRLHTLKMDICGAGWRGLTEGLRASLYWAVSCRHLEGSTVPTSGLKKLEFSGFSEIPVCFFVQCTQTVKELRFNNCSFDYSPPIIPPLSSDAHAACNPHLRLEVYGRLRGFSKSLRAISESPAATILVRIKHLAVGCCAFAGNPRALPLILLVTKDHLETLELRKLVPTPLDILGIIGPIDLTPHHQLRRFIFKIKQPAGDHNFEVFELETNDSTFIEDIEIHIQQTATHSWREDLGMEEADTGHNWKNLDEVLLGPRYPFLRKVDIIVFLERLPTSQSPQAVQTAIVEGLCALLSNLMASRRIQLEVVVKLDNMPL